jgi:N-acetylglutamate synthase-like GNAT family acetyltransferase
MSLTARVLPVEEWHRMDEALDPLLAELSPVQSRICVVEEDGEIVARWLLYPQLHAECIWIAPQKRKTGRVGLYLLSLMQRTAKTLGFSRVITGSETEDVTKLLAHIGAVPIPALQFSLSVEVK